MAHAVVEINVWIIYYLHGYRDDDLLLSAYRTTPSKDFTDDVLGPGPPYNNDAAKQGQEVQ